ncbi:MAG: signal peptide peptidase SppA [Patescibacteria group bacterium]|nr:signal peptide peptidase SppA [Patescibacteria group bacterium]
MSLKQIITHAIGGEGFKKNWSKIKKVTWFLTIATILVSSIFTFYVVYGLVSKNDGGFSTGGAIVEKAFDDNCDVAGITLHGELVTYIPQENIGANGNITADLVSSEGVVSGILSAEADTNIKAILLEIDSYGGSPVAGEEIARALKETAKPTVVLIRGAGLSSAYWAATGADKIFASKNSDVGGIGVTMSYLDNAKQNQNEGLFYNELSSGRFKDVGAPDKKLSTEERALLMRDVNIIHENFINDVAENRKLDAKKVEKMADGSSMLGQMALENGLIDEVGVQNDVNKYLRKLTGEDMNICW